MKTKINEISIRYNGKRSLEKAPHIRSSRDAKNLFLSNWDKDSILIQEQFKVMLLNNSNVVKGIFEVSAGGITSTLVDIRILFAVTLKTLSTAIIISHNHPSGTICPSSPDRLLTDKIKKAGELLDIKLLDHLIITPNGDYFSFADDGLL